MNSANVIVSSDHRAREAFEKDAESTGRDVKAARLKPYAFCIRNPEAVVLHVDVGNEVFAAAAKRGKMLDYDATVATIIAELKG